MIPRMKGQSAKLRKSQPLQNPEVGKKLLLLKERLKVLVKKRPEIEEKIKNLQVHHLHQVLLNLKETLLIVMKHEGPKKN